MPYNFDFDLSPISQKLSEEITKICRGKNIVTKTEEKARHLAEKIDIPKITGLEKSFAQKLVEDLIKLNVRNNREREKFAKTKKRALFLPHCSRKYMDARCQAKFAPQIPSYFCRHCSSDCLINQATNLAKKKNYNVYVIAGGSCLPKILNHNPYEGVVGVACCEEIKLGHNFLKSSRMPSQGVPLLKNGCANTKFSMKNLQSIMES